MTQALQSAGALRGSASKPALSKELDALKEKPEVKRELGRLKKASQDVEAIFLKQLIGEMRKGQTDGLFGKTIESQMYTDFLDEAIAQQMARGRGIGIADTLYKSMESVTLRSFTAKQAAEAYRTDEIGRDRHSPGALDRAAAGSAPDGGTP